MKGILSPAGLCLRHKATDTERYHMLNYIWAFMILVGVLYAAFTGRMDAVSDAALNSAQDAVSLCITMAGVMALWMGLMEVAGKAGLIAKLSSGIQPFLSFLFPKIPKRHVAREYIATNFIANILGLGWACTPAGLKAMEALAGLEKERGNPEYVKDVGKRSASSEMCTFLVMNISSLHAVFQRIFTEAFDLQAIFGGFSGSCVIYGIKRGLFSNEAGVGSAPNASASAEVEHPVKQGLVQVLSVFIDTLLVCSATAFMCMCSGVEPSESLSGAPYVQAALSSALWAFGPIFITIAMIFFAFTTLLGNLYYVDNCLVFLLKRQPSKKFMTVYHIIAALVVFIGAGLSADLLWGIADVTMGAMTIINMPVIIILGKYAIGALKDYEAQRKEGKRPVFKAKNINLPFDVDYWK